MKALDDLTDQLRVLEKQEGEVLLQDLQKRIALIEKEMKFIERQSKLTLKNHRADFNKQLKEITDVNKELNESKKTLLYELLDKIDIHEETVRFKSHLAQLESVLHDQSIEKGKRLSFILQELGREINTITAKCNDAKISNYAITIKVELEKIREQAQNII